MNRFTLMLIIALLISGCSNPLSRPLHNPPRQQFAEALDHYLLKNDFFFLEQMARQQPTNDWSVRARQLSLHIKQQQQALQNSEESRENWSEKYWYDKIFWLRKNDLWAMDLE